MRSVEERQRRTEDVGGIRSLDTVRRRRLDDGDWPASVPHVVDGGAQVAVGRCPDELARTRPGRGHGVEQECFSYSAQLTDGWDAGRYELAGVVSLRVRA